MLVLEIYGDPKSSVAKTPLFQQLAVAQQGRAIVLPELALVTGALTFGSVLSLPVTLDQLVPRLATAIDGNPATQIPRDFVIVSE